MKKKKKQLPDQLYSSSYQYVALLDKTYDWTNLTSSTIESKRKACLQGRIKIANKFWQLKKGTAINPAVFSPPNA